MVFRGELAGARDVLDDVLVTSSDADHDTPFTLLGDLALVEHLQGSFDRALQAGEAFWPSFAATNVGRWDYHKELFDALSTAALGDEVTARHRLSVVVDRLEASPHPAAMKDLRLALGASAMIDGRLSVAAPLLAGLEPETVSTNILGLLTRHYQARLAPRSTRRPGTGHEPRAPATSSGWFRTKSQPCERRCRAERQRPRSQSPHPR